MNLTLNTAFAPGDLTAQAAVKFAELLEKQTGGNVEVLVYQGGDLFPFHEELDAIKTGAIDITWTHPGHFVRGVDPSLDIFGGIPRIVLSLKHGRAIVEDRRLTQLVAEGMMKIGVHFLGYMETVIMAAIFNTVRETPKLSPEYFGGLKYGQWDPGPLEPFLEYAGIEGVFMSSVDRNVAIAQGTFNVGSGPLSLAVALGWGDIMKHALGFGVYSPSIGLFNLDRWNSLSSELRTLIADVVFPETQAWVLDTVVEDSKRCLRSLVRDLETFHYITPQGSLTIYEAMQELDSMQKRMAKFDPEMIAIINKLRPADLSVDPEIMEVLEYAGVTVPS